MQSISTIRGLFESLGGMRAIADLVGVKQTAVYMAMQRGSIPHRWRMPLYQAATSRSIKFDPALLGLEAAQ